MHSLACAHPRFSFFAPKDTVFCKYQHDWLHPARSSVIVVYDVRGGVSALHIVRARRVREDQPLNLTTQRMFNAVLSSAVSHLLVNLETNPSLSFAMKEVSRQSIHVCSFHRYNAHDSYHSCLAHKLYHPPCKTCYSMKFSRSSPYICCQDKRNSLSHMWIPSPRNLTTTLTQISLHIIPCCWSPVPSVVSAIPWVWGFCSDKFPSRRQSPLTTGSGLYKSTFWFRHVFVKAQTLWADGSVSIF